MRISDWSSDVCSSDLGQLEVHARGVGNLDLDLAVVEVTLTDALAETLARGLARAFAGERVEQPLHRGLFGGGAHRFAAAVLFEPHGFLDEVARDLFDVAADIADFGEFGRLDLDEGGVGELGETARNLGLAAAGGADHQDILGADRKSTRLNSSH